MTNDQKIAFGAFAVIVALGLGGLVLKAWLFGQFIGGCPA